MIRSGLRVGVILLAGVVPASGGFFEKPDPSCGEPVEGPGKINIEQLADDGTVRDSDRIIFVLCPGKGYKPESCVVSLDGIEQKVSPPEGASPGKPFKQSIKVLDFKDGQEPLTWSRHGRAVSLEVSCKVTATKDARSQTPNPLPVTKKTEVVLSDLRVEILDALDDGTFGKGQSVSRCVDGVRSAGNALAGLEPLCSLEFFKYAAAEWDDPASSYREAYSKPSNAVNDKEADTGIFLVARAATMMNTYGKIRELTSGKIRELADPETSFSAEYRTWKKTYSDDISVIIAELAERSLVEALEMSQDPAFQKRWKMPESPPKSTPTPVPTATPSPTPTPAPPSQYCVVSVTYTGGSEGNSWRSSGSPTVDRWSDGQDVGTVDSAEIEQAFRLLDKESERAVCFVDWEALEFDFTNLVFVKYKTTEKQRRPETTLGNGGLRCYPTDGSFSAVPKAFGGDGSEKTEDWEVSIPDGIERSLLIIEVQ